MLVSNTARPLIELVIPRDRTACDKSGRDEIQFLFKCEVGVNASDGLQLITTRCNTLRRVLNVGNQRIITPGTVGELNREEVGCHLIGTRPFLLLEEHVLCLITTITVTPIITRGLLLSIGACQVDLELSGLRNLEVQVRTYIQTIISITTFITLVVIPHAGHITFVLEVEGYEVLHEIRTTRQIEIRIV